MDLTELTTIKITRAMKKLTYLFVACIVSLVVASCGGGSNSSEADRIAQLEDSIRKIQSDKLQEAKESTEKQKVSVSEPKQVDYQNDTPKQEERGFKGASSRNDFPSVLSGTTWMTDQHESKSDRKFEFSGNSLTVYNSKPRWNYDDPLEWYNAGPNGFDNPPYVVHFYLIEEPQKGLYKIQYRKDSSGTTGMFNFEVKGNKFYYVDYGTRGGKRIPLKEI